MQTFVRIVEANSFSKAAETLDLPRASLTATIKNLEAFLGTQLLQRTTRRLSLTPDGAEYFQSCVAILGAIDASELPFRGPDSKRPKGRLKVDLPGAVGRNLVIPHIAGFHAMYPDIELIIGLTDRVVDLTQEGIDCAVRVGQLQDSALVGRQVGSMHFITCAAPSYLERFGTPLAVEDLHAHRAIVHFSGRTGRAFEWDFVINGEVVKVPMQGPIAVNDADAYVSCALQGMGLAQCAAYQVREHLALGALREVLAQWPATSMPVSLLYPQGRTTSPKVKAFANWVSALFSAHPDLQQPVGALHQVADPA